ncbi:MAG: hypothetical protein H6728_03750 [Myxococcales bacterium]|nr:hypothetical protein [Myxococcales bacterium]
MYVADTGNHRIRKITPDGQVSTFAGKDAGNVDGIGQDARLNEPTGLAFGPQGELYVADTGNHAIRKITPEGQVFTVSGSGVAGYRDGKADVAMFNRPRGLIASDDGSLYITDTGSHLIRWLDPSGQVRTLAGGFQEADWVDDVGSRARFGGPVGILLDALGFLLVADVENHIIRRISLQARVTTLVGSGGSGEEEGEARKASFRFPWGLAYDENNRLFIADTDNNRLCLVIQYPK